MKAPATERKYSIEGSFRDVISTLITCVKWGVVLLIGGIAAMWLFSPAFRHGVDVVEGPGPKPRDCDFMSAPLGDKGCHYEMQRMLLDKDGDGIALVNWFNDSLDNKPIPAVPKAVKLLCTWEKVTE